MAYNSSEQNPGEFDIDEGILDNTEDEFEVGKIQCLMHSTAGYDSLIFDLKPETDLKRLLELCKPVWNYLDTCPTLAEKLVRS